MINRAKLEQRANEEPWVVAHTYNDDSYNLLCLGDNFSEVDNARSKSTNPIIFKDGKEIKLW